MIKWKNKTVWIIGIEIEHEVREFMLNAVKMIGWRWLFERQPLCWSEERFVSFSPVFVLMNVYTYTNPLTYYLSSNISNLKHGQLWYVTG